MNQVIDILIEKTKPTTLPVLLRRHASEVMMDGDENVLKTNRHVLWSKAKVFYKRSIATPTLLRNTMLIKFSGEEGADAGALLYEFCEEVIRKVDEEYFEGQEDRRVPKSHWGSAFELEMAGAMVAHSILQGGLAFHAYIQLFAKQWSVVKHRPYIQIYTLETTVMALTQMHNIMVVLSWMITN